MEEITIDELIRSKICLDTIDNGVCFELYNSKIVDAGDYNRKEVNDLILGIVEVFYAWLRHNNIKIDINSKKE